MDENFEQTFHEESENKDEEEDLHPLPIPGPTLTQGSEPSLSNSLLMNMNRELERHLGEHLEMVV